MYKLYYRQGACSFAPHVTLKELGLPHELVAIKDPNIPEDFKRLSPLEVVPVLQFENGDHLTETAAILPYLADLKPEKGLAPKQGTMERYHLHEMLNFIATEIHKGTAPLFAGVDEKRRSEVIADLAPRYDVLAGKLGSREYLLPTGYSVADIYFFTVMNWALFMKIDLSPWPTLLEHNKRMRGREAVRAAMKAEGLGG